ncbi:MAG: NifB/NifX family molybdenum-iron cluster-binding protein [Gallionellaceae bacterium]|nr:NifB/NifX family molybdenum-iron cluster-binding protein [Gallionellaceae bacterium]
MTKGTAPLPGMKIAVSSQNRKTVTGHAGKCRKFWIFEVLDCEVTDKQLLELPIEETFHESHGAGPHPLDGINVLITGSMGEGMQGRLKQMGIVAVATAETDPDRAVAAWLDGTLEELPPGAAGHDHDHHHH